MKTSFEETFDEYHDLIRKEIAKDTHLDDKVSKVEQLVFLMNSIVSDRFSLEYNEKVTWFKTGLKKGYYIDEETNKKIGINYNQNPTKNNRLSFLREWLSLMLTEETRFKLAGNINRVDFGD